MKDMKELEDVATDQQTGGLAVSLTIDRVTASRLGIATSTIDNALYDAFGQRQISTMYTQLNQYHVILEALPSFQTTPDKLQSIFLQSNASANATGTGSRDFVRLFEFRIGRIERDNPVRAVHADSGPVIAGSGCKPHWPKRPSVPI